MRNNLGIALVIIYFAHAIASVIYAATILDPKGQAVWLAMPMMFTPPWLLKLLPIVSGPKSYSTWYLQTLVDYPVGFSFTSMLFYVIGLLLQRIWSISLWLGVTVGTFLAAVYGCFWFFIIDGSSYGWFALGCVGALVSFLTYPKNSL